MAVSNPDKAVIEELNKRERSMALSTGGLYDTGEPDQPREPTKKLRIGSSFSWFARLTRG